MTVIEYVRKCGSHTVQVMLSYSRDNLQIAQSEAEGGIYTLKEVETDGVC